MSISIKKSIPKINKEGFLFIFLFFIGTMILYVFSTFLGMVGTVMTVWCICFFRDPERIIPDGDGLVVSSGDGVIQSIVLDTPPAELGLGDEKFLRVSTFLSVFDVHVNRIPISGKIICAHYHPGAFLNASLDKASKKNERQSLLIETNYKDKNKHQKIAVVQIAGLVARRIVCDVSENDKVKTGERFGIIRFGSRVDIYLPEGTVAQVMVGQRVIGGETIIADLTGKTNRAKYSGQKI